MTCSNPLRRVRWSWALPLIALAITASLIIAAQRDVTAFWAAHPGFSDTPWELQSPATLVAQALNGPAFFWPLACDWARLPGVILFWAWLGHGVDRRLRGEKIISRSRFRRVIGNSVMLSIAAFFTFVFLMLLRGQGLLPFDRAFYGLMRTAARAPWNMKLRLTAWDWYVSLVWSLVYVVYFGTGLLRALTATSLKSSVGPALP